MFKVRSNLVRLIRDWLKEGGWVAISYQRLTTTMIKSQDERCGIWG